MSLRGAPRRRLVVDFDHPEAPTRASDRRCDFLVVADDFRDSSWIAPIECKKGALDASQVIQQLRAGAAVAEDIVPRGSEFAFRPIAAAGSVPKAQRIQLRKPGNLIACRGKREAVRLIKCGDELVKGLTRS